MTRPAGGELSDWSLESETAERLRALLRRQRHGRFWPSEHSPSRLVALAVLVGIVGGLGAVLFRVLIAVVHNLTFLGKWSITYDANLHTAASSLGAWIIAVPVIGALVVAFIVKNFAPEARGHGVPEVIDAIYYGGGIIRPVVTLIKALASGISIGTGGSVGREGPIIQIAAAFGSTLSRLTQVPEWQRITLVACGGAAGIAATFNTPIGGMLFAIEIILPEISARTVIPVALSAGASTIVGRAFFGDYPAFDIPALALPESYHLSPGPLAAYVVLGVLFGILSFIYIRAIYASEDGFGAVPGGYYAQHALGMAMVGVTFYLCQRYLGHYYVQGIGYAMVQDTLTHTMLAAEILLLLCFLKLFTTAVTLGSGGSGGIFSPSLFMGATFGAAFAMLVNRYVPGVHLDVAGTAVIGMASVVGAAAGAVVTAIVMIFEMTRDYNVIVPLMITVTIAYGARRLLLTDSIYSMKLTRRGHPIPDAFHTNLYMLRSAADFIRTPMQLCHSELPIETLFEGLQRQTFVPHVLVTQDGKVVGVLSSRRIIHMLRRGDRSGTVGQHARPGYAVVNAQALIFDVLARLRESGNDMALLTREGKLDRVDDVTGIVTWNDILLHGNIPLPLRRRRRPGPAQESQQERTG